MVSDEHESREREFFRAVEHPEYERVAKGVEPTGTCLVHSFTVMRTYPRVEVLLIPTVRLKR